MLLLCLLGSWPLLWFSCVPPRHSPACEEEEPPGWTCWEPAIARGQGSGPSADKSLSLGKHRRLPERGSDLWADLLMIYCPVLRPGTRGTGHSWAVWRIFPAGIKELEVGNQAASCQLLPPGLPSRPERATLVCFIFSEPAGAMVQWFAGGRGMDQDCKVC